MSSNLNPREGNRFFSFPNRQERLHEPASLLFSGYSRVVKLTTHFYLLASLGICGLKHPPNSVLLTLARKCLPSIRNVSRSSCGYGLQIHCSICYKINSVQDILMPVWFSYPFTKLSDCCETM